MELATVLHTIRGLSNLSTLVKSPGGLGWRVGVGMNRSYVRIACCFCLFCPCLFTFLQNTYVICTQDIARWEAYSDGETDDPLNARLETSPLRPEPFQFMARVICACTAESRNCTPTSSIYIYTYHTSLPLNPFSDHHGHK